MNCENTKDIYHSSSGPDCRCTYCLVSTSSVDIIPALLDNPQKDKEINKILCFYINVGCIDNEKTDAYMENMKTKIDLSTLPDTCAQFWVPVRGNEMSRVEVVTI